MLGGLRFAGRGAALADDAVVVVTDIEGTGNRAVPDLSQRLCIEADHVVSVPFDPSLRPPGFRDVARFRGLGRLRTATTRAFIHLAELVVGDGTTH